MAEFKYKTFAPRFWASLVDGLLLVPLALLVERLYASVTTPLLGIPLYLVSSFAFLAYSIILHGRYGQTVGKMMMGVRVLATSEGPISYRQAVLRDSPWLVTNFFATMLDLPRLLEGADVYAEAEPSLGTVIIGSAALIWLLLELGTMLLNDKRRALHDLIAGTVVVRTEALRDDRKPAWEPWARAIVIFFVISVLILVSMIMGS